MIGGWGRRLELENRFSENPSGYTYTDPIVTMCLVWLHMSGIVVAIGNLCHRNLLMDMIRITVFYLYYVGTSVID